ncbi:phage head morphogenesis protein [Halosimplex rubrum]|uniref:phage head morphogenesis protein n=1 Tax=Halosimplex rubrum TaxID=869889 RepID=UPI001C54DCFC|nr:phage minor head protein [Halosimplex rubrum]
MTTTTSARLAQPSGTDSIEADFLAAIGGRRASSYGRADRVRGLVRKTVGYKNDALGLTARDQAKLAEPRETFPRQDRDGLLREFEQWFREVLRDELLVAMSSQSVRGGDHWTAEYIRRAYLKAWQQATGRLQQQGVSTETRQPEAIVQLPVARSHLRKLYMRTYENLDSVTDDMATTIRQELASGLEAGENPRQMASRLTDEIDSITNTRLRTLARTEVIHSHTEATLDRYERAGADTVRHGEWSDADDSRVCPICSTLDGDEYSISEFRTGTFTFEPSGDEPDHLAGEYRLSPPAHPNCRCTILPVIG